MDDLDYKIKEVLENADNTSILVFKNHYPNLENKPVDKLILLVLELMEEQPSYIKGEEYFIDTYPDKNRSSLDIYRHCLEYNPNVTYREVLKTLYELWEKNEMDLNIYCPNVQRRVFKLNRNVHTSALLASYHHRHDEFGLYPEEWEKF